MNDAPAMAVANSWIVTLAMQLALFAELNAE